VFVPGGGLNYGWLSSSVGWGWTTATLLRDAHRAVEAARGRGGAALDPEVLVGLRERYDQAVSTGVTHDRLRDWHDSSHRDTPSGPGCATGENRSGCSSATSPCRDE